MIADDRSRTRRALSAVLATFRGFQLIDEAADGEEVLVAMERLRPDSVILDICMPRLDGIAPNGSAKARWHWVRIVAHSLANELRADALAAGADAFVPNGAPVRELLDAREPASVNCADADAGQRSQYS